MMLSTIFQKESDSELWLHRMNHVFIRLNIIMFTDMISTLPGVLTQIMLVLAGFWSLRYGNILCMTDSTIQEKYNLSTFSLYLYNSVKRQVMLEIITS